MSPLASIETDLTISDLEALGKHLKRSSYFIWIFRLACIPIILILLWSSFQPPIHITNIIISVGILAYFFTQTDFYIKYKFIKYIRNHPSAIGKRVYEIRPEGLFVKDEYGDGIRYWKLFKKLQETETHLFLFIGPHQAYILPKRAFASETEQKSWISAFREKMQ